MGAGRSAEATALLVPGQFPVLVAVENGLAPAQLAALLDGGVGAEPEAQYWRTFAESFAEFAGGPIDGLEAGEVEEFAVDGNTFATVAVGLAPGAGSTRFTTAQIDGRWRVDLLATLAPALGNQLRALATGLPAGPDGDAVREALVGHIPSLRAAVEQPGAGAADEVLRELEALIRFLAPALGG